MIGKQLNSNRDVRFRFRPRLKTSRSRKLYILQGLPGVGPARAKALLEHFGSVLRVFNASADELSEVNGFGKVLSDRIVSVLQKGER